MSTDDTIECESQIQKSEKSLTAAEIVISHPFPILFYNELVDEMTATDILSINAVGGKVILPIKAWFQADSLIAKKMIDSDPIMCIANDTDFAFLGNRNILQLSSLQMRGVYREKKRLTNPIK